MSEVKDVVIQAVDDAFIVVAVNARGHPVWESGEETVRTTSGLTYEVPIGIQSFEKEDRSMSAQVRHIIRHWAQQRQQSADVGHVAPVVPNAL